VTTIPQGQAARDAWAALPDGVRAEVIRLARNGQGHPDPAVAAIAVGRIRNQPWPWWRTALSIIGMSLVGGVGVAVLMHGGSINDELIVYGPELAGLALVFGASQWRPSRDLPSKAEVPNLRSFLASPDATAKSYTPRRRWLTPRRAAVIAAIAAGVAAVAWIVIIITGAALRPHKALHQGIGVGVLLLVVTCAVSYARRRVHVRRGDRAARRVQATEEGLRFDHRAPIPWSDLLGVTLYGPSASRPNDEAVIIWTLRDPLTVETPLYGSGDWPEALILAARAYMAAAKQAA
jgi:hypothetical protein